MTKDELTLANQLHNHLESCEDLVSNIDHALRNLKDPKAVDWNRIFRQGIEDDIIGMEMSEKLLTNLKALVEAYSEVIKTELEAI